MKSKILLLFFLSSFWAFSQSDSIQELPEYRNIVRWNLTPTFVLGSGSWVFGYERILTNKTSFSVNAGFIQMPRFAKTLFDSLEIESTAKRNGFSVAMDYRMYLTKRNKFAIPDGIYWGPYVTNYYFDSQTKVTTSIGDVVQSTALVDTKVNLLMVGVELGYQFTLGKNRRWTVDLILVGPSVRFDYLNINLDASGSLDPDNEYLQGVYDVLTYAFPGLEELATEGSLTAKGASYSFGAGYRYVVQVGFRF